MSYKGNKHNKQYHFHFFWSQKLISAMLKNFRNELVAVLCIWLKLHPWSHSFDQLANSFYPHSVHLDQQVVVKDRCPFFSSLKFPPLTAKYTLNTIQFLYFCLVGYERPISMANNNYRACLKKKKCFFDNIPTRKIILV